MREFALIVLAAALHGCGTTPNSSVTSGSTSSESCTASAVGSPVAIDEATTLGFSAADVVALLNGEIVVEATDVTDDSVETHTISYSFTPDETAQVEERTVAAGAEGSCISGTTLAIAGTLNVEADDGWISGSGPVQVSAQAAEVASVWVDASFSVTPSTELASVAAERTGEGCDPSEVVVRYGIRAAPSLPWATDLGSLYFEFDGCSGSSMAGDGLMFTLVPE